MRSLRERLWVKTAVGGMARYEGDAYHRRVEPSADIPGNPWFICTLWLAQWHIAVARSPEDLAPALEILEWAASRALPSGVLAEQVDPLNGDPLSVSPLTWSHATLVTTARDYVRRHAELSGRSRSPADLT
jgi:GH15 family glucan-1,4-alpha-glucosidase